MAFPVVANPGFGRQVFTDRGEALDVSQVLGVGGQVLQGQSLNGQFYGTFVTQDNIAAAGTVQGTATQLTKPISRVTTMTTGTATGVLLPSSQPGFDFAIINSGTSTITVYGQGAETVNGAASTTVVTGTVLIFYCVTAGAWFTK